MRTGIGGTSILGEPGAIKSDSHFIDNQLRSIVEPMWQMESEDLLFFEINTINWRIFKISGKFVVCNDFIKAMSDHHKLVFKITEYQKDLFKKVSL